MRDDNHEWRPESIAPLPPQFVIDRIRRRAIACLPCGFAGAATVGLMVWQWWRVSPEFQPVMVVIGFIIAALSVAGIGYGSWWLLRAILQARVEVDDEIRSFSLLGWQTSKPWSSVATIDVARTESRYEVKVPLDDFVLPLPLPMGLHLILIRTYERQVRYLIRSHIRLLDERERTLLTVHGPSLQEMRFSAWVLRKQLQVWVHSINGHVTWDERGLTAVVLRRTRVTDEEFAAMKPQFLKIRELQQIDLSETRVTDEALSSLELCERLLSVGTEHTGISKAAATNLSDRLAALQASAQLVNRLSFS